MVMLDAMQEKAELLRYRLEEQLRDDVFRQRMARFLERAGVTRGLVMVTGLPRSGKTLFTSVVSYWMKELWGITPLLDYHPKDGYGNYVYIPEKQFMAELTKVNELADEQAKMSEGKRVIENAIGGNNIIFDHAVLVLDEAIRYVSCRETSSNASKVYATFIQTWGHYQGVTFLNAIRMKDLDRQRVYPLRTCEVKCGYEPRLMKCYYRILNRATGITYPFVIPVLKYQHIHDHLTRVTIRPRMLSMEE